MKIKIVAVGKIKESYVREGIQEFLKRLKVFCDIEIIEIKDEGMEKESVKFLKYIDDKTFILDPDGKELSSVDFAKLVKEEITFIIGGPEGIKPELKKNSLSLSKMTFTHEIARLLLIEQIYRGFMINNNRQYHK